MNTVLNRLLCVALLGLFVAGSAPKARAQDVTVSFQTFYDDLSPYGQWVSDPEYGNVWVPSQEGDFRPYGTHGHWVMTDYGNTWVSDDPWGWACYHYGRWTYDPYYGWVWIPGYEWAPAWVSWRHGGGYCGWAPLGPSVSITFGYNCPESWWVFVAPEYMYHRDCIHYWRGPSYNTTYIRQTTIVNNYYVDNSTHVRYNYGPRAEVIERETHQPVQVYRVSQINRPGTPIQSGNRLEMYRPVVNRGTVAEARPSNVIRAPRAISSRPQPAAVMNASRQPQFHRDLPKIAPQLRQAAPQQQRPMQEPGQRPGQQMPQQRQMPQEQQRQQMNQQRQMQEQQRQPVNQQRQMQEQQRQQQMNQQRQMQEQQRQQPVNQQRQMQQEQQRQQQMNQQRQTQQDQQRQQQMNQQRQMQQDQQRQQQMNQQRQMQQEQQRQQQMNQQRQMQQEQQRQQQMNQQRQMQQEQQRQQQMNQQRQMQQEQQRQQQMNQQRQMQQERPMPQQRQAPPPPQRQSPPPPQRQAPPPQQQHEGGRR